MEKMCFTLWRTAVEFLPSMDNIYDKFDKMYDTEEDRAKVRQWLAQIADKELDEVCRGGKELLLDAFRERDYRTGKKTLLLAKGLLWLTVALLVFTVALLMVEIAHFHK
jgi:hypothetical protein